MSMSRANPPGDILSPKTLHRIGSKGNLTPIKFILDTKHFVLQIEGMSNGSPSTLGANIKRLFQEKCKSSSVIRRDSMKNKSLTECILLGHIQEIRVCPYDAKMINVKPHEIKKLLPLMSGRNATGEQKLKTLEIFFGEEFNLNSYKFLVSGLFLKEDAAFETWVENLESLISEYKSMSYFKKLDLWYKAELETTLKSSAGNHRLSIWNNFLRRNHHYSSIKSLQTDCRNLQSALCEYPGCSPNTPLERWEFNIVAKYFVHSPESIAKVFEKFIGDDRLIFHTFLENANISDLQKHSSLLFLYQMFDNYFKFVGECDKFDRPKISPEIEMQRMSENIKEAIQMFAGKFKVEGASDHLMNENWLSSYYILDYLYSSNNTVWSPETTQVYQDMTHPLSHYFINSSHNTFLTGHQYSSFSSVEAYARVLRQGCRCIEIDVWDGPKNKPKVKHGGSPTPPIKLKDVLTTIKKHAFATTPYPLIISIENHCSLQQQKTMAEYFWLIFGKALLEPSNTRLEQLPSPEELKHRIILKGRKSVTHYCPFSEVQVEDENCSNEKSWINTVTRRKLGCEENRKSNDSDCSGSSYIEPNTSEYLLTGNLWRKNKKEEWICSNFLLTSKALLCIEKRVESSDETDLKKRRSSNPIVRSSRSLAEVYHDLHHDQLWYHGILPDGDSEATKLVKACGMNGAFLVAQDTITHEYMLWFYKKQEALESEESQDVHKIAIVNQRNDKGENVYFLKDVVTSCEEILPSIFELIEHYKSHPIHTISGIYIEHLGQPVHLEPTHESKKWFYPDMDRCLAERTLEKLPINGAFLARYQSKQNSEVVISFRFENIIKHCRLKNVGGYLSVSNLKFRRLEDLIDYYSRHTFYKNVKLNWPVGKTLYGSTRDNLCVQMVYNSRLYGNHLVERAVCRVRAIQSYKSTDPDLLSFNEGDIIVNVVKEQDFWWRGTKANAEGEDSQTSKLFRSCYVEEIDDQECPFDDYFTKANWDIGKSATTKICNNKQARKHGVRFYIVLEDFDGTKRKLGAMCLKTATEWVDLINMLIERNKSGQKLVSKTHRIAHEFSNKVWFENSKEDICPDDGSESSIIVKSIKSMNEITAKWLFRSNEPFFISYHQRALTRIYPRWERLQSSNFNPSYYWNMGSQLVALNFQTPDKPMQWNRGKFQQNGNCGYVLKPTFMLPTPKEQAQLASIVDSQKISGFSLQIISARHLKKSSCGQICPVVEVEVLGVDEDCCRKKTGVQETGLNPCWNETFHLSISRPELALLQVSVFDEDTFGDRTLLGECTIPVPCLRLGYRSIQLNNAYGYRIFSSLLVRIT